MSCIAPDDLHARYMCRRLHVGAACLRVVCGPFGRVSESSRVRSARKVEEGHRGDERRRRRRLEPVEPVQQHREHAARRLVHLARSRAGERVELVQEEHAPAERLAVLEERRELLLALPKPAVGVIMGTARNKKAYATVDF